MSGTVRFLAEQEERMNTPDERFEDYVARMATVMNRSIILPKSTRKTRGRDQEDYNEVAERSTSAKRRKVEDGTTQTPVIFRASPPNRNRDDGRKAAHEYSEVGSGKNALANRYNAEEQSSSTPTPSSKRTGQNDDPDSALLSSATSEIRDHPKVDQEPHGNHMYATSPSKTHETSNTLHYPAITKEKMLASSSKSHQQFTSTKFPSPPYKMSKDDLAPQAMSTQRYTAPTAALKPVCKPSSHLIESENECFNTLQVASDGTTVTQALQRPSSFLRPDRAASSPILSRGNTQMTSAAASLLVEIPTDDDTYLRARIRSRTEAGAIDSGPFHTKDSPKFLPQGTSTPLGSGSASMKISSFSSAKRDSKRDQVLKVAPKKIPKIDTSNITTPNVTVEISTSSPAVPTPPQATSAGPSKIKSTAGTDKHPSTSKGKKKKRALVTPLEYAQILSKKLDIIPKKTGCLKGRRIFYTGGDMQYASESTQKKMDLILQHGGLLVPIYDPHVVTHIISDAPERPTLRALQLKSKKDIAPNIPVVTWKWVTEARGEIGFPEILHAAFASHLVKTTPDNGRTKVKSVTEDSGEISRISQFTQDKLRPPPAASGLKLNHSSSLSLHSGIKAGRNGSPKKRDDPLIVADIDPLAEFYEQAKAEQDNACSGDEDGALSLDQNESDEEYHGEAGPPIQRGFTCDTNFSRKSGSKNQDIIDKLQQLMDLHQSKPSKDDFWRSFSYRKSIGPIRNHPRRIRSYAEAMSIRGVGHKTAEKIMEIIQTGGLRRIAVENTEDVGAAKIFTGIYGVGQTTAYQWYVSGCRTLDDIRMGKGGIKLSSVMEIGLRYYDDINTRMPRHEAQEIFQLIKPIALQIDPRLFIDIMGSFRRGKLDCGDIDIMITRPTDDNKTHAGIIPRLLKALHAAGIITEDLALPDEHHEIEATYRGLCKLPDKVAPDGRVTRNMRRRLDILSVPWESRGAALLYYTGDDIFNRAMRFKANKMGFSLNQRGLFEGVVRDPRDRRIKINDGTIIASETEEEIFKILGVPWQEPHERVRSH